MNSDQGFFQLFAQGGGGEDQVCICVQSVWQTRGIWKRAPLGFWNFYYMQSGGIWDRFHNITIYCAIEAF